MPLLSGNLITTNMSPGFPPVGLVICVPRTGSPPCSVRSRPAHHIFPLKTVPTRRLPTFPPMQRLSDLLSFSGFLSACSSLRCSITCFLASSFFLLLILYFCLPPQPGCHSPAFFLSLLIFKVNLIPLNKLSSWY